MGSRTPIEGTRAARQHAWRDVNANISSIAVRLSAAIDDAGHSWAFMCECGEHGCRELLKMRLADYRAARELDRFLVVPGHEASDDLVVERHESYLVVEVE